MLKRDITYVNFDGETVTETFYFNISKPEIMEMEFREDGRSMVEILESLIKNEDAGKLIREIKKIVLDAYGERTPDRKGFIKTPEVREAFSYTAAYQTLYMELCTDSGKAADFMNGALPADLVQQVHDQDKPTHRPVVNSGSQLPPPAPPEGYATPSDMPAPPTT